MERKKKNRAEKILCEENSCTIIRNKSAKEGRYDYFTTTLSISPLKNAQKLNEIGERLAGEYGVAYLVSDFKKRNGYKRSTELSKIYGLYRQDYCGCIYSKNQREREKKLREEEESSVKS